MPSTTTRTFNGVYEGAHLDRIAFPMGGIGAGMICLEGMGALTHVSLCNHPDLKHEPLMFAAVSLQGERKLARVLEGPVPAWKAFPGGPYASGSSPHGGLPRFQSASFAARFPFARIALVDRALPLEVALMGWSPFEPGNEDDSSLPLAGLEYTFTNRSNRQVDAVFSFNSSNFMRARPTASGNWRASGIRATPRGFILYESAHTEQHKRERAFAASVTDPSAKVNHSWHRGVAPLPHVWRDIENGACYDRAAVTDDLPAPGATLFVPFSLAPGDIKTIVVQLAWHVPESNVRTAGGELLDLKAPVRSTETYAPWYASRFGGIEELVAHWQDQYDVLKSKADRFSNCFYSSTIPPEVLEAVSANLSILKSPTLLRQADGRLWGWEGSADTEGFCPGSCIHVWNYAQAIAHLFPSLERGLRETEFGPNQDEQGCQVFRSALPIRPPELKNPFAAADGQLGGIMKLYRDWRICGDAGWLETLWPKIRASLDHCIRTWDPRRNGWLEEPHHNTYDMWLWGPNGMCASLYLGALKAATLMGRALNRDVAQYASLFDQGVRRLECELFNGEYFFQRIEWRTAAVSIADFYDFAPHLVTPETRARFVAPDALALAEQEGPPYQYGGGCLSDGVIGAWLAWACGLGEIFDQRKIASHLCAVFRHNFREQMASHANVWRSGFALRDEGGLLNCTWPNGDQPTAPIYYAGEAWTGIEYQVASHMASQGMIDQALAIVRAARSRYDGRVRNPFDEIEAGHWYVRALSSYALLQAFSGARYDAVERTLYLQPPLQGDFRCFIATATGYGIVGVKDGQPFLEIASGEIPYARIEFEPAAVRETRSREAARI